MLPYLLGDVMTDIDFLVVQKHAIDSLNGSVSGLSGFVMNETEASRTTLLIGSDFARQYITKRGEGIMKSLKT